MSFMEEYGSLAFGEAAMRERMDPATFEALRGCAQGGAPMSLALADAAARAMREWALEKGATHYTHWFQPLSGVTAEKHDGFLSPDGKGGVLVEFGGKQLIKGEPDASSFPSGGLRATFEARGYTAWDPTSGAFIKDGVLCIPTTFFSYAGHALDKRTPLLRSMQALNTQALRVLRLFGTPAERVTPMAGLEQEYFLVDRALFLKRKDLTYTGRTLLGARPPKGQELDGHYFGSIHPRVSAFMKELNQELWRLGIPAKTEHNETAPAQHELAVVYEKANAAVDHNQLVMELMRNVARRHGLACLLHEKPFLGVNGSGKHNNWSLQTDTGLNLFEPGETPAENAQFLTFFCAVLRAVDEYQDLLRISVASAGNDCRLGGEEAPPAIVSIFVGAELEAVLDYFDTGKPIESVDARPIQLGVDSLPAIPRDTADRNRTSPFAFTGNKFELRMLGSEMSGADCNTVLNTIMAESLSMFADALEGHEDFHDTLEALLRSTIQRHRRIVFNGNGYDEAWRLEAKKRGLSELTDSAVALPHYMDRKNVELFERHGVLTAAEMQARCEIELGAYAARVCMEGRVLSEMVRRDVLPAAIASEERLARTICDKVKADPGLHSRTEKKLLRETEKLCERLYERTNALDDALTVAENGAHDAAARAELCRREVLGAMEAVRQVCDGLECRVGRELWPYPSCGRLLYMP